MIQEAVASLTKVPDYLYEQAAAENASAKDMSLYFGVVYCFGHSNANRPDVASNATVSEGLA